MFLFSLFWHAAITPRPILVGQHFYRVCEEEKQKLNTWRYSESDIFVFIYLSLLLLISLVGEFGNFIRTWDVLYTRTGIKPHIWELSSLFLYLEVIALIGFEIDPRSTFYKLTNHTFTFNIYQLIRYYVILVFTHFNKERPKGTHVLRPVYYARVLYFTFLTEIVMIIIT